jgi:hypothetical protein
MDAWPAYGAQRTPRRDRPATAAGTADGLIAGCGFAVQFVALARVDPAAGCGRCSQAGQANGLGLAAAGVVAIALAGA